MTTQGIQEAPCRSTDLAPLEAAQRDALIVEYAPQVKFLAHQLITRLPSHILVEDLISAGVMGLIDAIDKFDPSRNTQFKTYATFRIRGAMLDELRSLDWVPRSVRQKATLLERAYAEIEQREGRAATDEEVAESLGMDLDAFDGLLRGARGLSLVSMSGDTDDEAGLLDRRLLDSLTMESDQDPLNQLKAKELQDRLAEIIEALPDKEKTVVALYYYEELNMKEIGRVLGVTESRVSQIHTRAVARMRGKLRTWLE